jgi:hypothetical protein
VKVHVDANERLKADWASTLGNSEFVGQAAIDSQWPAGYSRMTGLDAGKLQK